MGGGGGTISVFASFPCESNFHFYFIFFIFFLILAERVNVGGIQFCYGIMLFVSIPCGSLTFIFMYILAERVNVSGGDTILLWY